VAIGQLYYQRTAIPSRPVKLIPRPALLAGRENLLEEMHARLSQSDGVAPRFVTLSGLGGAGKTSLAVEYAYRHMAEFGLIWQFAAENIAVLAAGFSELAAEQFTKEASDAHAGAVIPAPPDGVRFFFIVSIKWTIKGQFHEPRKWDDSLAAYLAGDFFSDFVQWRTCGADLATSRRTIS